jgi:hypothetical protein
MKEGKLKDALVAFAFVGVMAVIWVPIILWGR